MNDEQNKTSPASGESEITSKQDPLDETEAEGIVGGTGSNSTSVPSTDKPSVPDESTWDGGFTRPE